MSDNIVDLGKKREEKEEEELPPILIYPCVCGNAFWLKTSEGDICGLCDTFFDDLEFNIGD